MSICPVFTGYDIETWCKKQIKTVSPIQHNNKTKTGSTTQPIKSGIHSINIALVL